MSLVRGGGTAHMCVHANVVGRLAGWAGGQEGKVAFHRQGSTCRGRR